MPIASTDVYTKRNIWPLSPFISLLSPFISIIYLRKLNSYNAVYCFVAIIFVEERIEF